jgi:hypothetical protein
MRGWLFLLFLKTLYNIWPAARLRNAIPKKEGSAKYSSKYNITKRLGITKNAGTCKRSPKSLKKVFLTSEEMMKSILTCMPF